MKYQMSYTSRDYSNGCLEARTSKSEIHHNIPRTKYRNEISISEIPLCENNGETQNVFLRVYSLYGL